MSVRIYLWIPFLAACAVIVWMPAQAASDNAKCLTCHSAPGLGRTVDGKSKSLHVSEEALGQSVHGGKACVDCHTDLRGTGFPHKADAQPVDCARCHSSHITKQYSASIHGVAAGNGDPDAPTCQGCHGTHDIRKPEDPKSAVYRMNVAKTCNKCHSDASLANRHNIPGPAKIKNYSDSVHGRAVTDKGIITAAVCTDCHGSHDVKAARDERSLVNKQRVPATCGKCHTGLHEAYRESIHGKALTEGVADAPVCTDCHGEHTIQAATDPNSSVYPTHVVATCNKCHESIEIQKQYGLPAHRMSTYIGSYHGVANKYGDTVVANCASCHGSHDIKPSSDPRSPIHKNNIPETCGKCHPGAGENFAKGSIHVYPTKDQDVEVYWVSKFYMLFVTGLIASFCGYIALDLFARVRERHRRRRGAG